MIRWSLQKGYITIPKSVNYERIVENSNVFDFSLHEGDMSLLVSVAKLVITIIYINNIIIN